MRCKECGYLLDAHDGGKKHWCKLVLHEDSIYTSDNKLIADLVCDPELARVLVAAPDLLEAAKKVINSRNGTPCRIILIC